MHQVVRIQCFVAIVILKMVNNKILAQRSRLTDTSESILSLQMQSSEIVGICKNAIF